MTVASCPKCTENVTIPTGVRPEAWVRCPLCQKEFALSEVLARLPPQLIVLTSLGPSAAGPVELGDSTAAPQTQESPGVVVEPAISQRRARSRGGLSASGVRRRTNLLTELLKIVVGGAVGCVLAILILWWAFGADPFQVAPAASRLAPWIVPGKLRRVAQPKRARREEAWGSEAEAYARHSGSGRDRDRPTPLQDNHRGGDAAADLKPPPNEADGPSGVQRAGLEAKAATATAAVQLAAKPRGGDNPASSHPMPSAESTLGIAGLVGVRQAPRLTADDLDHALQQTRAAKQAWEAAADKTSEQRRKTAIELYDALARLGEAVTFVDPRDERTRGHISRMHQMLLELVRTPKTADLISGGAERRLKQQTRQHQGVVLIGKVRQIAARGLFYETRVELSGPDKAVVSVMSRVNPADFYQAETRILMLGAIVEQPATRLAGYRGDEPLVIMGAYPVVLPKWG